MPDLIEMLIEVGFITINAEIKKAICKPTQKNKIDCGVYACVYVRNRLWGYTDKMSDVRLQEWRRAIYESIFLG